MTAVDGDLALLHGLEQGGLGLGAGAVDLVADHDVGEDRTRFEDEVAALAVPYRDAGDVGGEEVGGELDAAELAVDRAGERFGQQGLADPGDVFDQNMTAGDETGDDQLDGIGACPV